MTTKDAEIKRRPSALRRALLGAAATLALSAAWTTQADADTLADALVTAILTDPDYDAAVANLRATDESVVLARAGQRPSITGTAQVTPSLSRTQAAVPGGRDVSGSAGFQISQNLYDSGQTSNSIEEAFANVRSARNSLVDLEQDILLAAVSAYVEVLRAEENVKLAENNISVITSQLDAAQDRFEVGEVTRTDVAQARARVAESRAGLQTNIGLLGQARETYLSVISVPPVDLAPLPPLPELPATREEAIAIAEATHPAIAAARETVAAQGFNVREELGGIGASVDVVGSVTGNYDIDDSFFSGVASASLQGSIPIYQSGINRSNIRSAQALASASRANLQDVSREIRESVGIAWEVLRTARANIEANRAQIEANEIAFEGVQEEAKVGSRTTLDVLDAEDELLDSRVALNDSLNDEYIAAYSLLESIGLLTVGHLGLDVDVYNPEPHYQSVQRLGAGFEETEDTEWRYNLQP